jgi:hypothetical protein
LAGVVPGQVTAALVTVTGSTASPAGIELTPAAAPKAATGASAASSPTLSAGARPRSTLALAGVVGGAVTLSSRYDASATLIVRALVVGGGSAATGGAS